MNDGSMPIRRLGHGPQENVQKSMKKEPNLSTKEMMENGFIKNIKKINKLEFVDDKTKKRFKDDQIVYYKFL